MYNQPGLSIMTISTSLLKTPQPQIKIWETARDQSAALKFELSIKLKEVEQVLETLSQLKLLSNRSQRRWLTAHQPLIAQLMDEFMADSVMAMDGFYLDQEAMQLSTQLVSQIKEATSIIHHLVHPLVSPD